MNEFPDKLLSGFRQFKQGHFTHEHEHYRILSEQGQRPEAMVIACCDSRAVPEIVFNASPGEIFVVRSVANLVPPYRPDGGDHATAAALEFAVHGLGVKHIVIMGHSRCGGIKAALEPTSAPLSPDNFIGKWMSQLTAKAKSVNANNLMSDDERQLALEHISIRHSVKNLRTYPYISTLEKAGRLELHGTWFDISSGELWAMDSVGDNFKPFEANLDTKNISNSAKISNSKS